MAEYKLILLNGPLKGREINLPLGSLNLGNKGDLLVPLEVDTPVELVVEEQGVQLVSAVPWWVEGVAQQGEGWLPLGKVVDIAGQGLLLGEANDTLLMQALPARKSSKTGVSYYGWLWVVVGLIVIGILWMSLLLTPSGRSTHMNQKVWLQNQLSLPKFKGIKADWSLRGVVTLSGYCSQSSHITELINAMKMHGVLFQDQTQCQDQLLRSVKYILQVNGYSQVAVTMGKAPGTVNISGAIQSGAKWDKVTSMFNTINGLVSWHVSNNVNQQLRYLLFLLRKNSLLGNLSVILNQDGIMINGVLNADQQRRVSTVIKLFEEQQPGALRVIYQNIPPTNEHMNLFPAPIVSVGGNHQFPYIELENGMRLQIGTYLPNGFKVESMDSDGIELVKEGQLVHIPINL